MSTQRPGAILATLVVATLLSTTAPVAAAPPPGFPSGIDREQVPSWSDDDLAFFLHGSFSTEVVPERLLAAWAATRPARWTRIFTPIESHSSN